MARYTKTRKRFLRKREVYDSYSDTWILLALLSSNNEMSNPLIHEINSCEPGFFDSSSSYTPSDVSSSSYDPSSSYDSGSSYGGGSSSSSYDSGSSYGGGGGSDFGGGGCD